MTTTRPLSSPSNDDYGYNDATEVPNRAEAERAVTTVASLFAAT